MQFQLLGPLQVVDQGTVVPLGGIKQRGMLAMLLLRANRVVPSSKLLESLWDNGPPPTARKMLQNAASSLRDMLARDNSSADPPLLLTHAPGYLLHVEPSNIDVNLFARHTEQGRSRAADGDWESARRELRSALGMWRGPVLADLVEVGAMWPEAGTVQNTYLVVAEELFDAELACGRHREVVSELESAVEREPSRQHLAAQLMLGLYRCGRELDALEVYHRIRAWLIETHGLEPVRELRELQQSVLNQDPKLDWHGTMPALGGSRAATVLRPTATLTDVAALTVRPEFAPVKPRPPEIVPANGHVTALAEVRTASLMAVVAEGDRGPGAGVAETAYSPGIVAAIVHREAIRYGGNVVSRVGSFTWVMFGDTGDTGDTGDAAMRAVQAGLAIREALVTVRPVRIAVVSTMAILGGQPGDGTLRGLDDAAVGRCLQLASEASAGRVWVGDEVKRATERSVRYERASDGAWGAVERLSGPCGPEEFRLLIEGPREIQKLRGLLNGIYGDAAWLAEWIEDRCCGDIPENAVVELIVSVQLPEDDAPRRTA